MIDFETPHRPGAVASLAAAADGLTLRAANGALRLTVIAEDCIQVRFSPSGSFPVPFSYAVAKAEWPHVPFTVREEADSITVKAARIAVKVHRADCTLTFTDVAGRVIGAEAAPIGYGPEGFRITRGLPKAEKPLGLAPQPTTLDLRGRRYPLWNTDPIGTARDKIPSYFSIPFYLGVAPDYATGLFWDNPSRGFVDIGHTKPDQLLFGGTMGELRYYQFAGDVFSILNRYTELTGRMPLPPLWALGFHISRWSYVPESKVREVASELRKRNLPCDAIYLDIDYMDGYRVFTWNKSAFPKPERLIRDLANAGIKTVAILDPGIKQDPAYSIYKEGIVGKHFVSFPDGTPYIGPCWPGDSAYPDFTNPATRAWWAGHVHQLVSKAGLAGLWNDMNEPVIFNSETMPDEVQHHFDGYYGKPTSHVEAHNVYGMLMARATLEGLQQVDKDRRWVNLVRAGHAGVQRYASTWTGDNNSDWDHLKLAITMTINSGLAGLPFNGPDVGGFFGDCEPELFVRFMQLGCLMPYFRVHSAHGTRDQEPYAFGPAVESIARAALELRYRLLPYFYTLFAEAAHSGAPILRPMFMADLHDPALRGIEDQFMVGPALLAAPVLEGGQHTRRVYLPRGAWYDFHTGARFEGGMAYTVPAGLDVLPLFLRAGAAIPMYPVQQYVGEKKITEVTLRVGVGAGESFVYDDAGEGQAYRNGERRWLQVSVSPLENDGLRIMLQREGTYAPPYTKIRVEVYGIPRDPDGVTVDGAAAPIWYYEKGIVEFSAAASFEIAQVNLMPPQEAEVTIRRNPTPR